MKLNKKFDAILPLLQFYDCERKRISSNENRHKQLNSCLCLFFDLVVVDCIASSWEVVYKDITDKQNFYT